MNYMPLLAAITHRLLIALALIGCVAIAPAQADAQTLTFQRPATRFDPIRFSDLPPEARKTLARIWTGGPFPYPRKDGAIFANREELLPKQPRGYYREYTVYSPYTKDRGPLRIIAGRGKDGNVRSSGEYYFTIDHYRSFRLIVDLPPAQGI